MIHEPANRILGENLVDSRKAALVTHIPLHWLVQKEQRNRRGIPHYMLGKLLRFKIGELMAWMEAQQPAASQEEADA